MTGRPDCDVVSIDSGYSTPPALEGRSCVYVLRYSAFVRDAGWVLPPQGESRLSTAAPRPAATVMSQLVSTVEAEAVEAAGVGVDGSNPGEREKEAGGGQVGGGKETASSLLAEPSNLSKPTLSTETTENIKTMEITEPAEPTETMMAMTEGGGGEGGGSGGGREAGVWFYVGESDAIRERLRQHARRWGGGAGSGSSLGGGSDATKRGSGLVSSGGVTGGAGSGGGACCKLDAVVVAVENRSEARRLETAVIRGMKEEGFYLVSDKDGSRTHFS